jgi:hypothetical protein
MHLSDSDHNNYAPIWQLITMTTLLLDSDHNNYSMLDPDHNCAPVWNWSQ